MDHLPYPKDAAYLPLQVPYLVREDFDDVFVRAGFNGYPEARGVDRDRLTYEHYNADVLDPFLQEWIYFGLMSAIFVMRGISVDHTKFARGDDPRTLSSLPLKDFVEKWTDIGGTRAQKTAQFDSLFEFVITADTAIANLSSTITWNEDLINPSRQEVLYVSYVILQETLQLMAYQMVEYSSDSLAAKIRGVVVRDVDDFARLGHEASKHEWDIPLLRARLDASSWCPNQIGKISYEASIIYWLSSAKPSDSEDHSACSQSQCIHLQIDDQSYETKHVPGCPGCDSLGPDQTKLAEIIRKGGTPIICVKEIGPSHIQVDVAKAVFGRKYIAISHVWRDGLGNPHANTLPICQLKRLASLSQRVRTTPEFTRKKKMPLWHRYCVKLDKYYEVLEPIRQKQAFFWIDTLCILGGSELRNIAIRKMPKIYRKSDRVLVLDSSLCERTSEDVSGKILRILTCGWMRRLWTLQEAGLANGYSLFFQFGDSITPMLYLIDPPDRPHGRILTWQEHEGAMRLARLGWIVARNPFAAFHASRMEAFQHLFQFLPTRSTSKPEDEVVCLGTMLGIDISQIYNLKGQQRWKKFYELVGPMSPEVLFTSGPRLQEVGCRWAPETFLARPNRSETLIGDLAKDVTAIQRPQGLFVKLPSWRVMAPQVNKKWWRTFGFTPGEAEPYIEYALHECSKSTLEEHRGELPDVQMDTPLAILWQDFDPSDLIYYYGFKLLGILVRLDKEVEKETTLVHYLCRVQAIRLDWDEDDSIPPGWEEACESGSAARAIIAQGMKSWYID